MITIENLSRVGRPLLRLTGVLVVATIGAAVGLAFVKSALTGVPVPDMTGGMIPLISLLAPQLFDLWTRHQERQVEQAWKGAANVAVS